MLADHEIRRLCELSPMGVGGDSRMIFPFLDYGDQDQTGKISSGLTSFGYDARLGDKFKQFCANPKNDNLFGVVDPKNFNEGIAPEVDPEDGHFDIKPHGFILGFTIERFHIPDDVCAVAIGKSTYARCGIIVTSTPLEPGWAGHVTVEIANMTDHWARVYVGEGICQFQFHHGGRPEKIYTDRSGKYQDQGAEPVSAKA